MKLTILLFLTFTSFVGGQNLALESTLTEKVAYVEMHDRVFYEAHTQAFICTDDEGRTMPYRLFVPSDYDPQKKYPLVLSFHGAGARGNDNSKHMIPWVAGWSDPDIQRKHSCLILMPQCSAKQQWVDVPWREGSYVFHDTPISQSMLMVKAIFDSIEENYAVDRSRIYVMGMSMGGYATWNFVMRYPKLVAAAVPICGAGDPSMAEEISNIPIWAFHGDEDLTVPLSGSTDMIRALRKANNNNVHMTIYEGVGHNSYERAWHEKAMIEWLFNQQKAY